MNSFQKLPGVETIIDYHMCVVLKLSLVNYPQFLYPVKVMSPPRVLIPEPV